MKTFTDEDISGSAGPDLPRSKGSCFYGYRGLLREWMFCPQVPLHPPGTFRSPLSAAGIIAVLTQNISSETETGGKGPCNAASAFNLPSASSSAAAELHSC